MPAAARRGHPRLAESCAPGASLEPAAIPYHAIVGRSKAVGSGWIEKCRLVVRAQLALTTSEVAARTAAPNTLCFLGCRRLSARLAADVAGYSRLSAGAIRCRSRDETRKDEGAAGWHRPPFFVCIRARFRSRQQ